MHNAMRPERNRSGRIFFREGVLAPVSFHLFLQPRKASLGVHASLWDDRRFFWLIAIDLEKQWDADALSVL